MADIKDMISSSVEVGETRLLSLSSCAVVEKYFSVLMEIVEDSPERRRGSIVLSEVVVVGVS